MIFLVFFLVAFFLSLQTCGLRKQIDINYVAQYLFLGFLLIVIPGLRYEWGADYFNYKSLYEYDTVVRSVEIVYFYTSYFLYKIGLDYNLFLFLMAFVSIGLKLYFYYERALNPFLVLFAYLSLTYSIYELGFVRQALALGFICLSLEAFLRNKKKTAFFWAIFGSLCQASVFVVIGVYFAVWLTKEHKQSVFKILIACFGSYFCSSFLFEFIIDFFSRFDGNIYIVGKIISYSNKYPSTGFSLNVIRALFMITVFNWRCKNIKLLKLYNFGIIIYMLCTFNVQFATRFYSIPCLIEPLLVDDFVKTFRKSDVFFVKSGLFLMYGTLLVYNVLLLNYWNYQSIWASF